MVKYLVFKDITNVSLLIEIRPISVNFLDFCERKVKYII